MGERDDFLTWVRTTLHDAELALLNGDADPRRAIWSRQEPVSILGALRNSHGRTGDVSVSMDGRPRTFTLRATQVYRREGGAWKVAHRHADSGPRELDG
jgi:hypothetical protein